ncbi:MAG: hypothetical protein J6Z22_08540, partial [Lachnospiraceae bacterium]|nr:hypothetical protein [Lachnospiraceae bacterium]
IRKKMVISWCLYMAMIVAFFGFLCPGTSYDSVVINSQMKRLTKAMSADPIPKSAESTIKSSYSVISRVGYRGKKALEKNLTKEQQEKIAEFDEYGYLRNTNVYLHANIAFTNVDVSAYKKIYVANYQSSKPDNGIVALQVSYAVGQKKQTVKIDMSEYLNWVTANFDTSYDQDYTLVDHNIFPISSALDLYVTNISISYNSETQEINGLTLDGYVLEK